MNMSDEIDNSQYFSIKYSRLVNYYIYLFVPLSLLTGYLLRENYTIAGLTPSLIFSTATLVILVVYIIRRSLIHNRIDSIIIYSTIVLIIFPFYYIYSTSASYIFSEFNYSITILLPIIIIVYLSKYCTINSYKLQYALHFVNVLLICNIIFSSFLNIGYSSYTVGQNEIGVKGFLYGGNTASVLSLAVLSYYTFHNKMEKLPKTLYIIASFYSAFLVKTIASFLAPLLLLVFFLKNYKRKLFIITVPILIISPLFIYPLLDRIQNVEIDSYRLERMGITNFESISSSLLLYVDNSRRIQDSIRQFEYQLEKPATLFFGVGRSGQIKFYESPAFNFSGMDIFDLLFRYGILGLILISLVFVVPIYKYMKIFGLDSLSTSSSTIIFYSIFGGYVFNSITILIYLAILISIMKLKIKYFRLT